MMSDCVKVVTEDQVKRIHGSPPSGKLHKGHNVVAATASIPSKYQTVVTDNSERKGFLSRSKRFSYESQATEQPGPGTYVKHAKADCASPSFSKKGTGGFASKDKRIAKQGSTCSPGAGAYKLPSFVETKNDFNKATSTSVFHRPIAKKSEKEGSLPAPNMYKISGHPQGKANNVSADAAFKSKSKRELLTTTGTKNIPAPWQYHVSEELVKDRVRVPLSSFKSKTVRKMQQDPTPNPGPGTYHPHEDTDPVLKTVFPRKHYLCISAPAMPLPKTPPAPGPGSYEVVNYQGLDKHYMSSPMFVSTTSRWTNVTFGKLEVPGPAHYRPEDMAKQSFIYNASGRWI